MSNPSQPALIDRIQGQLRTSASRNMEPVSVPPFTCFFNPDSTQPWSNYAIPDEPVTGDASTPLALLRTEFHKRGCQPRFEYIAEYAPDLEKVLLNSEFAEESRTQLMLCTPTSWRPAPEIAGLHIDLIRDDDPLARIQVLMNVQNRAFGDDTAAPVDADEAAQYRVRFRELQFFIAELDGQPISVGSFMQPYQGVAEIAGIGTLAAFRRRGIASAVTAHMAAHGFEQGLTGVFLTAADANAGRVYARVGFLPVGTGLSFIGAGESERK